MIKYSLLIGLLWTCTSGISQDLTKAKQVIDTLCAPSMHGRGATFSGDSIAASYIQDEFRSLQLNKFGQDFLQPFVFNINTFPGKVKCAIGKKELNAGKDFILEPSSPSGAGYCKLFYLDTTIFNDEGRMERYFKRNFAGKAICWPSGYTKKVERLSQKYIKSLNTAACIVEVNENKLTASLSGHQRPQPYFQVRSDALQGRGNKINFDVEAVLMENKRSQNVIAFVEGKQARDSFVVISAHYDHLGRMGKEVYFPGANDNASGVSLLLQLASYYTIEENRPEYTIVFIAFGAEEAGLIGSRYYTEHPLFPLEKIKFMINLDLVGTGDDGLMVVNGTVHPEQFRLLEEINKENNYLPAIKKRGKAPNSDHYFFSEKGVPAFFLYTLGGIRAYHDIYDRPETLPLTKYKEVFLLIREFIGRLK
jgi:aminopeptidase YwaD